MSPAYKHFMANIMTLLTLNVLTKFKNLSLEISSEQLDSTSGDKQTY